VHPRPQTPPRRTPPVGWDLPGVHSRAGRRRHSSRKSRSSIPRSPPGYGGESWPRLLHRLPLWLLWLNSSRGRRSPRSPKLRERHTITGGE
jgi:hypothetical protein